MNTARDSPVTAGGIVPRFARRVKVKIQQNDLGRKNLEKYQPAMTCSLDFHCFAEPPEENNNRLKACAINDSIKECAVFATMTKNDLLNLTTIQSAANLPPSLAHDAFESHKEVCLTSTWR